MMNVFKNGAYEANEAKNQSIENLYNGFKDVVPYNFILNGKFGISLRCDPHPISFLINERFSYDYSGKLLWREINVIKEEMDKAEDDMNNYINKVSEDMDKLRVSIREQNILCNGNCLKELYVHLKECDSNPKCKKDCVAYECRFKENGRCLHYYNLERLNEKYENYQYVIDNYHDIFTDLQVKYERALVIKDDMYEEYKNRLYDDDF